MRKLVIGDIHGGFRAMKQVLERAKFNEQEDMLIGIGDYVDGWPDSYEVIKYLVSLPHFKGVLGNHDEWFLNFLQTLERPDIWVRQGGQATLDSYADVESPEELELHRQFLESLPLWLEIDNKIFVHGGVRTTKDGLDMEDQRDNTLLWDRDMFSRVNNKIPQNISPYDEVYIGHTTTELIAPNYRPVSFQNIHLLDQGGGWSGKLTVMDIDTKEYWQSDFVNRLYPEVKGRG